MEVIYNITGLLGSIASIAALIMSYRLQDKTRNKITFFIISALSILTVVTSYLYKQEVDKQLSIEQRKQVIKLEAQKILESSPSYISLYEPGENEGVLYSILILLEKNKDIFPETYELYKKDVIMKIEKSNAEKDIFRRREQMEIAGKSGVQFLKSLAK